MKRKKRFLIVGVFILLIYSLYSQEFVCGNEILEKYTNEKTLRIVAENDELVANFIKNNYHFLNKRSELLIPVVVHILQYDNTDYISDEFVMNTINELNDYFNSRNHDISKVPEEFRDLTSTGGISFCLASKSIEGFIVPGIIRKKTSVEEIGIKNNLYYDSLAGSTAWDTKKYLNIWVADTGDYIKGSGSYPGIGPDERQGVVIGRRFFGKNSGRRYNQGKTLVHEIGHYLGLKHIWGDHYSCDSDDGIEDTPPQLKPYYGCPEHPSFSCGYANMFMNYMDYVDDECMYMFTQGQMNWMKSTIYALRPELILDTKCIEPLNEKDNFDFVVYPNPTKDFIYIDLINFGSIFADISIYNALGNRVFYKKAIVMNHKSIEINNLAAGIYILKIGSRVKKIIKH